MLKSFLLALVCVLYPVMAADVRAEPPSSFRQAKKMLVTVYQDNPISFYCGCRYTSQGAKLTPDWASCGFQPRKNAQRAARIEWEHVVPAWAFGHQLQCWQEGGREACRKDPQFRRMEADLHNLVPAIGEVNGDRSNFRFAMLEGESRLYGQCDMEVDFRQRKVEPPLNRRGDIARTYFYMQQRYGLSISRQQQQLFSAWDKQDPLDAWELERHQRISILQGNANSFIQNAVQLAAGPPLDDTQRTEYVPPSSSIPLLQTLLQRLLQ